MAELNFSFGTMGSGKSTMALQINHNLAVRGLKGALCTQLDRQGARVSSQLGVSAEAIDVAPGDDLFEDVIQKVGGVLVHTPTEVQQQVEKTVVGEDLEIEVIREGRVEIFVVQPSPFPESIGYQRF
ncbi:MAG: hypothetical protein F6K35_51850 [Okeania sp. SIO2H7]|nr:hypothetical protein [Okeania sp. SIO2H7]